jgi:hypothetical protein
MCLGTKDSNGQTSAVVAEQDAVVTDERGVLASATTLQSIQRASR